MSAKVRRCLWKTLTAGVIAALVGVSASTALAQKKAPTPEQPSLFRPADLVLLEGPDRQKWQKPEEIMDRLNIAEGSKVADIGAGAGWFTIRLARRVGPNGKVYAQDLQHEMIVAIGRRVRREGLRNVDVVQGDESSPNLPHQALDAVLVVDVYPEVEPKKRVRFLQNLAAALRPKGLIGIVNYKPGSGGPGPDTPRVPSESVERDAKEANLRVVPHQTVLRYQYLIVLGL
jgi:SAM-dependent methyltransferase